MKKSLLLVLALPLLLASCELYDGQITTSSNPGSQTTETGGKTDSETGGQTGQGTEGSGTGSSTETESHSGGSHSGEGTHSGGGSGTEGSQTGGGTSEGGGSGTGGGTTGGGSTGGGTETGGGTSGGGTSQTTTESVYKDTSSFGLDNSDKPSTIEFNEDITLTLNVGTNRNKNAPAYYASDSSLRFYFGNTLTVSNSKGVITRVVLGHKADKDDNKITSNVGTMSDYQTWTGSASSVTFTIGGSSGNIKLYNLRIDYTTSGGGSTGGGTTGGGSTGGGTETGGGGSEQSGNGNTSSEWTTAWTGREYDIAYSLFKGNLPCLKAFNGYKVGCVKGSTIMYFNPYIKGWSKESQTYYDNALRDMGYTKTDVETDEDGVEWFYYEKGTYYVQTSHYRGDDGEYYFDVYAYNDYQAPFNLDYEPTVDLTTKVYPIKSGYKAFSKTINGITFSCSNCTENNSMIQLDKNSTMEITSSTALSKMDILFNYDKACCLVYAGTSSSNAKVVYNNGTHFDFPSGTKYVKVQALLDDIVQIDCLSIK